MLYIFSKIYLSYSTEEIKNFCKKKLLLRKKIPKPNGDIQGMMRGGDNFFFLYHPAKKKHRNPKISVLFQFKKKMFPQILFFSMKFFFFKKFFFFLKIFNFFRKIFFF